MFIKYLSAMHRSLLTAATSQLPSRCARRTMATNEQSTRVTAINKAMQVYVEKSRKQKAFIDKEAAEFENGKRHLANMMGMDLHSMKQEDINKAVQYLFPSGLFAPRARPVMHPPEMLHPAQIVNQFDETGRPKHSLFYTIKPAYYALMNELGTKQAKAVEYEVNGKGGVPAKLLFGGTRWMTIDELGDKVRTTVSPVQYNNFILAIEHLAAHNYAVVFKDFIMSYRTALKKSGAVSDTKFSHTTEIMTCEETGRPFVRSIGQRKHTYVTAEVYGQGSGLFTIDDLPLSAIYEHTNREQCIAPLIVLDRLTQYDVVVRRDRGKGASALAGATRLAVARALVPQITERQVEMLRLAGLLTHDARVAERKKINQPGARAKYIWKRR